MKFSDAVNRNLSKNDVCVHNRKLYSLTVSVAFLLVVLGIRGEAEEKLVFYVVTSNWTFT